MRVRKRILLGVIVIVTVMGVLQLAGLSLAASRTPPVDDDCRLFSCIFGATDDVD